MAEIDVELILKVKGNTLSEVEDKVTEWITQRIKARIMAQPQAAVRAHDGGVDINGRPLVPDLPQGLKINTVRMTPEMKESIDKAEVKRKQKFEEV